MERMKSFSFGVKPVRVGSHSTGDTLFSAKDVCDILGLENVGQAVSTLEDGDKFVLNRGDLVSMGIITSDDLAITRLAMITESGVYDLVFKSIKPEARSFQRWVTHEVLPQIRKTGAYGVVQFKVPQTLSEALRLAADQSDQIEAQKATIATLEPKAAFSDRVALATDGQSVAEVAKILGTGQNRLYQWLRGKKILMADNLPYQEHLDCGRFRVIEQTWEGKTSMHTSTKTLVTGKGVIWLQRLWDEDHMVDGVSA